MSEKQRASEFKNTFAGDQTISTIDRQNMSNGCCYVSLRVSNVLQTFSQKSIARSKNIRMSQLRNESMFGSLLLICLLPGGFGGMCTVVVGHPFDTIKVITFQTTIHTIKRKRLQNVHCTIRN